MQSTRILHPLMAAALLGGLAGCAHQTTDPDKKADRQALQEAPLGSRIKRRADQAPVDSFTKTQVEQMRMQQGLQQTTTFQKDRK